MDNLKEELIKTLKKKKVILLAVVLPIIAVVIMGSTFITLGEELSSNIGEHVSSNPVQYNVEGNAIEITDESIDNLIRVIESTVGNLSSLGLTREDIITLYTAEIVTSEINRLKPTDTEEEGKYYGKVYVKRGKEANADGSPILEPMEYIELSELESKVEGYKNGENSSDELLKYFSIDEASQICFVDYIYTGQDAEGNTVNNASVKKLPYKDKISQYVVPIEFLLDLCYISESPEITLALANKIIKDTEINIAVLQKNNSTTNTVTNTYQEETATTTKTVRYSSTGRVISQTETAPAITISPSNDTYHTDSPSTESSNIVSSELKITSIKSWFMEATRNYTKTEVTLNNSSSEDNPSNMIEDEERKFEYTQISRTSNSDGGYTCKYSGKSVRKINQKRKVDTTTTENSYEERTATNPIDKTDEVVKIIRGEYSEEYGIRPVSALGNLVDGAEVFFTMLKSAPRTQSLESLMRYILGKATGNNYGVSEFDFSIFSIRDFNSTSDGARISAFGTKLTKEEFVSLAESYSSSADYVNNMAKYAGDFYDICTKEEYNINPAIAYAHACLETGYGSSNDCKNDKNYFGMAHYNNASSGERYSSVQDSIEDYCKWIINNATEGTNAYNLSLSRAQEFANVNSKFNGMPDSNIYVLYSTYAYLGDTHICDEPDFSNPAGNDYYIEHDSDWGSGGRIYIYTMYEAGGLYTGEYATRCGHTKGTDETTITEKADYSAYSTNEKIKIAKTIFGSGCIRSFSR